MTRQSQPTTSGMSSAIPFCSSRPAPVGRASDDVDNVGGMFREAQSTDFNAIMARYRQLHPDDPYVGDGSDRATFAQIMAADWLHLYLLVQGQTVIATHLP